MDGPPALDEEILGLEVGRGILRGVRLDSTASSVVSFAESPVDDRWAFGLDGTVDPDRIGLALEDLLDDLGVLGRPLAAVGISIGTRFSGVGSGPTLNGWLRDQAQRLGQDLVFAGETGVAFAPYNAVECVVEAAGYAGFEPVRVDLAPVAGSRLLDRAQHTVIVGSGLGWRARLRDLEVVEALEREGIGPDVPFQILDADGTIRQLTGYRQVAISPGLRAAGFSPGQMAVSVGVAMGVANQSPANLLDGAVISHRLVPSVADAPFFDASPGDEALLPSPEWPEENRFDAAPQARAGAEGASAVRPVSSIRTRPGPARSTPARSGRQGPSTAESFASPATHWEPPNRPQQRDQAGALRYGHDLDDGPRRTTPADGPSAPTTRFDMLIGFLVILAIVLVPVYLFL